MLTVREEFGHSTRHSLTPSLLLYLQQPGILPTPPAAGTTASTDINDAVG